MGKYLVVFVILLNFNLSAWGSCPQMNAEDASEIISAYYNGELEERYFDDFSPWELQALGVSFNDLDGFIKGVISKEELLWEDTILEGDFYKTGPASASSVVLLFYNGQFVAYQVVVTAPAVLADYSCRFNNNLGRYQGDCDNGHFVVNKLVDKCGRTISTEDDVEFE